MAGRTGWAVAAAFAMAVAPAGLAADAVKIGGNGTLLGAMEKVAQAYERTGGASVVVVSNLGSSGGVRALLHGAIDIALNARPLKPGERERGARERRLGRTPFVFVVAAARSETDITSQEVADIFHGSRGRWADGSPIRLALRPADDSDNEAIDALSPAVKRARAAAHGRPGMYFAGNDQENADYVEKIPGAFGAIGLAVVLAEGRSLRPLRLDGVAPTPAALAQGRYPLYKPAYLVTTAHLSPAARRFFDFVVSPRGAEVLRSVGILVEAHADGGR